MTEPMPNAGMPEPPAGSLPLESQPLESQSLESLPLESQSLAGSQSPPSSQLPPGSLPLESQPPSGSLPSWVPGAGPGWTRGPRTSLVLGALFVLLSVAVAVAVDAPSAVIGVAVAAWVMGYSLGSTMWAGVGAACFFVAVGSATESVTALGITAALALLTIVQMERSVSMRRRAQPDDRVRRSGVIMLAMILFASFLIIGIVELVTADEAAGFQLPLGLTIVAAVTAVVARLLDRATNTSNAAAFRPGTRH